MGYSVIKKNVLVLTYPSGAVEELEFVSGDVARNPKWMREAVRQAKLKGRRLVETDDLVSAAEIARRYRQNRSTINGWVRAHDFPPILVQHGKYKLYSWKAVKSWHRSCPKDDKGHLQIAYSRRKAVAMAQKRASGGEAD